MKRTNVAVWLEKYNRWQIKVQKDNIRKTFTSSTPGRNGQRECHRKADAWLDDNITDSRKSIKEMSEKYMEQLKLTTSQSHYNQYQGYFDNWINPKIGVLKIESLSEQHLQSVINYGYSKNLAKKTLSNMKACLLAFLKYCRACKATTLFVEGLYVPKGAKSRGVDILTPDDLKKLFAIDTTVDHGKRIYEWYINAYRFQVLTGLRPGEVIGLQWRDIKDNSVNLSRAINAYGEITKGKNDNAQRTIHMTSLAQNVIAAQRKQTGETTSEYVFCDKYGDPAVQVTYYKHWKAYCKHNKITDTTPYELRHTFVSAVKTLPEGYLKQTVGHSQSMDTYGVYSHEQARDKEVTALLIQDIFEDILKDKEKE